jgi:hypothetical protein
MMAGSDPRDEPGDKGPAVTAGSSPVAGVEGRANARDHA